MKKLIIFLGLLCPLMSLAQPIRYTGWTTNSNPDVARAHLKAMGNLNSNGTNESFYGTTVFDTSLWITNGHGGDIGDTYQFSAGPGGILTLTDPTGDTSVEFNDGDMSAKGFYAGAHGFNGDGTGITGNLPINRFNSGLNADGNSVWYGDGTWKLVASGGGSATNLTPWNTNINGNSYSLSNVDNVTITGIYSGNGAGLTNVPGTSFTIWFTNINGIATSAQLPTSGVTPGTYNLLTVDSHGIATAGANIYFGAKTNGGAMLATGLTNWNFIAGANTYVTGAVSGGGITIAYSAVATVSNQNALTYLAPVVGSGNNGVQTTNANAFREIEYIRTAGLENANYGVPQVIWYTGGAGDWEDAASMQMILMLHKEGKINLRGVGLGTGGWRVTGLNDASIEAMSTLFDYYKVNPGQVPLALYTNTTWGFLPVDGPGSGYTTNGVYPTNSQKLFTWYMTNKAYGKYTIPAAPYETTLRMFRRVLSDADTNSITFAINHPIAPLTELFDSPADQFSPMTGQDLFNSRVRQVTIMAGDYTNCWVTGGEYNISTSTGTAYSNIVARITRPITWIGFSIGVTNRGSGSAIEPNYINAFKQGWRLLNTANPMYDLAYQTTTSGDSGRSAWGSVHALIIGYGKAAYDTSTAIPLTLYSNAFITTNSVYSSVSNVTVDIFRFHNTGTNVILANGSNYWKFDGINDNQRFLSYINTNYVQWLLDQYNYTTAFDPIVEKFDNSRTNFLGIGTASPMDRVHIQMSNSAVIFRSDNNYAKIRLGLNGTTSYGEIASQGHDMLFSAGSVTNGGIDDVGSFEFYKRPFTQGASGLIARSSTNGGWWFGGFPSDLLEKPLTGEGFFSTKVVTPQIRMTNWVSGNSLEISETNILRNGVAMFPSGGDVYTTANNSLTGSNAFYGSTSFRSNAYFPSLTPLTFAFLDGNSLLTSTTDASYLINLQAIALQGLVPVSSLANIGIANLSTAATNTLFREVPGRFFTSINSSNLNWAYTENTCTIRSNYSATEITAPSTSNQVLTVTYTNTTDVAVTVTHANAFSWVNYNGTFSTMLSVPGTNITMVRYWTDAATNRHAFILTSQPNLALSQFAQLASTNAVDGKLLAFDTAMGVYLTNSTGGGSGTVASVSTDTNMSVATPTSTPAITFTNYVGTGPFVRSNLATIANLTLKGSTTNSGNVLFSPDDTYNIGGDGVNRPNTISAGSQIAAPILTAYTIATIQGFESPTNLWVANTVFNLGTNYFISQGAATVGITGIGNTSVANREKYGQLMILATGTVVFTNEANIKFNDGLTSRTITNGQCATIAIDYMPGRRTNGFFVQTW